MMFADEVKSVADAIVAQGLDKLGYQYVNLYAVMYFQHHITAIYFVPLTAHSCLPLVICTAGMTAGPPKHVMPMAIFSLHQIDFQTAWLLSLVRTLLIHYSDCIISWLSSCFVAHSRCVTCILASYISEELNMTYSMFVFL
jgi:hypothetical protein